MLMRYYPFEVWMSLAFIAFAIAAYKTFRVQNKKPIDYLTIFLCLIIFIASIFSALHFSN